MQTLSSRLRAAFWAASIHFGLSLVVALLAAILVFGFWYPFPYRELVGGSTLFLLVVSVDIICGPLLTAVLFNPSKPKQELIRDLTLVAAIQVAALAYGIYTVAMARPVHVVFEVDRMRVVTAADIDNNDLATASPPFNTLPWTGPTLIGARDARDGDEKLKSIELSLQGNDPSVRPHWWQSFDLSKSEALKKALPLTTLRTKHQNKNRLIDEAVRESGKTENSLLWLPLTSFKALDWVVLIDATSGQPKAYAQLDGFK